MEQSCTTPGGGAPAVAAGVAAGAGAANAMTNGAINTGGTTVVEEEVPEVAMPSSDSSAAGASVSVSPAPLAGWMPKAGAAGTAPGTAPGARSSEDDSSAPTEDGGSPSGAPTSRAPPLEPFSEWPPGSALAVEQEQPEQRRREVSRSRSPSPCPPKPARRSLVRRVSVSAPASPLLPRLAMLADTPTPMSSTCTSLSPSPTPGETPAASRTDVKDLRVRFLELPKHSWEDKGRARNARSVAVAVETDSGGEDEEEGTSVDATPSPSPTPAAGPGEQAGLLHHHHHGSVDHHRHHHHHHHHHGLHGFGLGRRRLSSFLHLHMPDHWPSVPQFKLSPPCSEDAESADNLSFGTPQYSGLRRFSFGLGLRRLSQVVYTCLAVPCTCRACGCAPRARAC